jgi:hypothetical protein
VCVCVCSTAVFWQLAPLAWRSSTAQHIGQKKNDMPPCSEQQRSRPKAWPSLFESHPGVSTSPAAPDTTVLPLHWRARPGVAATSSKTAVRVAHSLTVWHSKKRFFPQYRTCLTATQLPTATSLIVIPSFGRTYISPNAAEFANSRRRPAGGWYFGTLRLRSPTPAAPPACCTGVVRSAAATACRGPAGGDFDLLDSSPLERRLQEKYSTSHCDSMLFSLAVQI